MKGTTIKINFVRPATGWLIGLVRLIHRRHVLECHFVEVNPQFTFCEFFTVMSLSCPPGRSAGLC